ncbi:xylulokinase [Eubacterium sp.]|uniref:xylulokinase n=1 Tax=Eubacterium sp. TaxID=142586 RepID=UPI003F068978
MYYIGIDLGTSSCKMILVDEKGTIVNSVTEEYPVYYPHPAWSEQNPTDWWDACVTGIDRLISDLDRTAVKGIGVAGQMHGLVVLDENDNVIRPAILWNDARTAKQVEYLNNIIGKEALSQNTANIAFAGFTAPKLLWMKENEPELFERISKIMLPKDYIVYRLTGVHSTDYSDASGTLLLDVEHKCWSKEMCRICCVNDSQLPKLYDSFDCVATVKNDIAKLLGLPKNVTVSAGAGDNAAAAIGTGTVGNGRCNISVGTSGTIFISSDTFGVDKNNSLHSFAHADGGYHLMGCMLSAASCNKWWQEDILNTKDFTAEQKSILPESIGKNHIYYLPYLMGERSPINDTYARGMFIGMTMDSKRADMTQAVLEGVAFAMRDCFEVAKNIGINISRSSICGGGSKSSLWKTIFANVLGIPLDMVKTEQGPSFGAAILAMVACGEYGDVQSAVDALVQISDTVYPDKHLTSLYEEQYEKFKKIYPAVKNLYKEIK